MQSGWNKMMASLSLSLLLTKKPPTNAVFLKGLFSWFLVVGCLEFTEAKGGLTPRTLTHTCTIFKKKWNLMETERLSRVWWYHHCWQFLLVLKLTVYRHFVAILWQEISFYNYFYFLHSLKYPVIVSAGKKVLEDNYCFFN